MVKRAHNVLNLLFLERPAIHVVSLSLSVFFFFGYRSIGTMVHIGWLNQPSIPAKIYLIIHAFFY